MIFPGCLVIESGDIWKIVVGDQVVSYSKDLACEELASEAASLVRSAGLKDPNVILAPGSNSVLFCLLETDETFDARDQQALLYELENHLPIDAESTVADYVTVPDSNCISTVAIEVPRWKEIADAFEEADLQVRSIIPSALLATRAVDEWLQSGQSTEIYLADGDQIDAIRVQDSTIHSWRVLPKDAKAVARHRTLAAEDVERNILIGFERDSHHLIGTAPENTQAVAENVESMITRGAKSLLQDSSIDGLDLRRGALAPGDPLRAIGSQLRMLMIAATACLLALAVGGWWRSNRIENEIETVYQLQTEKFKEAFPNNRSRAILRHVRSEHAKVLGSLGQDSGIDAPKSAPSVLRGLIGAIPGDVRYQISRIDIRDGDVELVLRVKDALEVGKIAAALSENGFKVSPPGTEQISPGVIESTLTATWEDRTSKGANAG